MVLQASCSDLVMPVPPSEAEEMIRDFLRLAGRLGAAIAAAPGGYTARLGCAEATLAEGRILYSHEACLDMFPLLAELSLRYGAPVCTAESDIEPFAFIEWLEAEGYRYRATGPCVYVAGRRER